MKDKLYRFSFYYTRPDGLNIRDRLFIKATSIAGARAKVRNLLKACFPGERGEILAKWSADSVDLADRPRYCMETGRPFATLTEALQYDIVSLEKRIAECQEEIRLTKREMDALENPIE
ncbi:MAG: hypothetical protein IJQ01_05840 [Selenomonadaceae bacterium]|nr:hypothetical protein [Selenomonadaceae bacterium]